MSLVQGSKEWLEWRRGGIGGSDVPAIMGESEYKTAYQLWLEKTGRKAPEESNWAMQRGTDAEPKIRAMYELQTGMDAPADCVEHAEHSYLRVSLDGYLPHESLLTEYKYPGAEKHEQARKNKVPETYYGQVQYQLAVTGMKRAHYVSYNGESIEIVPVTPDQEYIDRMLPMVKGFWEMVLNDTPPPMTDKDVLEVDDLESVTIFEEWKRQKLMMMQIEEISEQVNKKYEERKALLEAAREKIKETLKHPKVHCAGVSVVTVNRKSGQTLDIRLKELA